MNLEDGIAESSLWNMYGYELDRDTHKLKLNGRIFWGSTIVIKDSDGSYDFSRIDSNHSKVKLDTDRKAINYAKKLNPVCETINNRQLITIYSRARFDSYIQEYESIKQKEINSI